MSQSNPQPKIRKECCLDSCTLPTLEYVGGQIVVYNEHHGKKHINHISIDWVIEQAILDGKARQIIEKLKGENLDAN